ncbi:MAG TPA: hypothetical protein VGO45_00250 [Bacteroidia bacterium]|jgi:hypothetical protein|nr:hypothetical protein [Bacteroidia bacterium]
MRYIPAILSIALLFSACTNDKWAHVTVNNTYSLSLPPYLEPGTFYADASLQYKNEQKEFYIVMIDEKKTQFKEYGLDYDLSTYYHITAKKFDSTGISRPMKFMIGKDSAYSSEFKGQMNNNPVYYKLVSIESDSSFYKMLIWMMASDKERYAGDVNRIVHSFRETGK